MTLSIAGKTAIVTGSASGVGLAIARLFVERGARVMFADIDEDRLDDEIGEEARRDGPVRMFAGDLSTKLCATNLISATIDAFDRVDILVNASRQIATCDPMDTDGTVLDAMLRHNLTSTLRLSQMVAKRMIAQAERDEAEDRTIGAIVNISTIAPRVVHPELMAYSIACAALEQATRSLAVALAPSRIRVNAVAYGSVMSAHLQTVLRDNRGWRDAIADGTPLGRIAAPAELAETVQYLASDAAEFVTGQIVTVDGGRSIVDAVGVPAY
jgi:7-alpha-hydroxysteroid dehydrogenase